MKRIVTTVLMSALLLLPGLTGAPRVAKAAQDVTVTRDNSPVRQDPSDSAKVIDYMQSGDEARVSSFPVNANYYKVRARNGQYGWIHMKYLSIEPPKEEEEGDGAPEPVKPRNFALRGFGGLDFFKPNDLNDAFGFSELNTGWFAGGEFGWSFSPRFSALLRADVIVKDVVAKERTSQQVYSFSLRSYPIMAGLDFKFIKDFPVHFSLGIFAGLAVRTSFAAEAIHLGGNNRTIISSSPFTTLVRVNVTRPLGRMFSIFGEAGYRHLKTDALDTTNDAVGGDVFKVNGVYKARVIDLSGIILSAGMGFHF